MEELLLKKKKCEYQRFCVLQEIKRLKGEYNRLTFRVLEAEQELHWLKQLEQCLETKTWEGKQPSGSLKTT